MEKKKFKKKLTLSVSSFTKNKPDTIRYAKSQNKSSIIIEKKTFKSGFRKTNKRLKN